MTKWGLLLLVAYIALGAAGRLSVRQASGAALALTVVVVALAMVSYRTTTPTDRYVPDYDATVYSTGNPWQVSDPPSTEDDAGVTAADWADTDHHPGAISGTADGDGG